MEHIKIYSGSEINCLAVKNELEINKIEFIERNDIAIGVTVGFGTLDRAVHIFVSPNDVEKAKNIIEKLNL